MSYSFSLSISDLLGFLSIDPITPTTNGLKKKRGTDIQYKQGIGTIFKKVYREETQIYSVWRWG